MFEQYNFEKSESLDLVLADKVSQILQQAILDRGKATLAVSGGSTPKGFFNVLSHKKIDWKNVIITLVDERWVDIASDDSNTRLVRDYLLQNKATEANFFHLKAEKVLCRETLINLNVMAKRMLMPLDVVILGMGEDGHTASLFPCSEQIAEALDTHNENALMVIDPKTAPYQRISFTFATLIQSRNIFLHLCGGTKQHVLNQALSADDVFAMPIRKFLQDRATTTQVYWSP